jgi:hypothetical protein
MKTPCDDAVIKSGRPGDPCAKAAEPWILAVAILGSSMAFIDGTVVNVALPALQASLGGTVIFIMLICAGLAVTSALFAWRMIAASATSGSRAQSKLR